MKIKALPLLCLFFIPMMCMTSCDNPNIVDPDSTIKKLSIDTQPDKVSYEVGDAFTSIGLKVNIIEVNNGQILSTKSYTDYTLSIDEGTILEEGVFEVMVIGSDPMIRSTSFEISVRVMKKIKPIIDVINQMKDTNNYTVNNLIGSDNQVKGLMTSNALYWGASEEAYFTDEGFGYGSYNDKTFRYKISDDGIITNATYITDLGPKARDHGLFSPRTLDNYAARRVSNYNMKDITTNDLTYLNNLQSVADNPNRYEIDVNHSLWLFNCIGHTQLCNNPAEFLDGATIYAEVKDYGLDVDLIVGKNINGIKGCSAKITNIGATKIPGMDDFMKNPVFENSSSHLDKLKTLINNNNYVIDYDDDRQIIVNSDYIWGTKDGLYDHIVLKENNKLSKAAGNYKYSIVNSEVKVGEAQSKTAYLTNYDLLNNLGNYFVIDSLGSNKYTYKVNPMKEMESQLSEFLSTYTNYKNESIKTVGLEFTMSNEEIFQVKITINASNKVLDTLYLKSFGQATNSTIDTFIKNLY